MKIKTNESQHWKKRLMAVQVCAAFLSAIFCLQADAKDQVAPEVSICDIKDHVGESITTRSTVNIFDPMTPIWISTTKCKEITYVSIDFLNENDPLNLEIDKILGDTDFNKSAKSIYFIAEAVVKKAEYNSQSKVKKGKEYVVIIKRTLSFEYE